MWYRHNFADLDVKLDNDHSAKIKPPTTASTAVKPTLTEVEMAPLSFAGLLLLVALAAPVPVSVADPVAELPDPLIDAVDELRLELEFSALAWKAAKVLLSFALTAKTIPFMQ